MVRPWWDGDCYVLRCGVCDDDGDGSALWFGTVSYVVPGLPVTVAT